jgi:hypothetical protein
MRRAGIRRITDTLRKPTTQAFAGQALPTKLAKESELVLPYSKKTLINKKVENYEQGSGIKARPESIVY